MKYILLFLLLTVASSRSSPLPQKKNTNILKFLSGGVAGTVSSVVTCPLEVVKTQLQSSNVGKGGLVSVRGSPVG